MKILLLVFGFLLTVKHPQVIDVKEFSLEDSGTSKNIFTSSNFSLSKTNFKKNTYYILSSRRNDDENVFQTLFLDTYAFEKIPDMNNGEEISVCVYYYKKNENYYRENINLTSEEITDEVIYIEGVRSQKYYYDYCGTNIFIKKTDDDSLLLLINNSLQTPKNWYESSDGVIEIKDKTLEELNELILND